MRVYFRTNLDLTFPEIWPYMDSPPPVGSYVESKSGLELQVKRVTFKYNEDRATGLVGVIAEVELHLGSAWESRSIADFNKWDRERPRR